MKTKQFKLNTIILSTMLTLLAFCLCGCASVNFVTYHNPDGSICEYVHLLLDEQAFANQGYTLTQIDDAKNEIATNSYKEAELLISQYRNKLEQEYLQQKLSSEEYTALYGGIAPVEHKWEDGNEYVVGLEFKNSTIYKKYYELLNGITFNQNTKTVKKIFYTKTYHYGTTNYGDYSIFNRIYTYYANTKFANISPQEANLTYSYSVSSRRFHSDAENISLDINGNYIHTWNVDPGNPARQIHFYTISANRSMWILTCIGIGLITCATLSIIGIFKYRKFNKKNN